MTCPLLKRSDGKKFGKSEGGESVWLDPAMTSPYKFYQYWLNCTDEDAPKLLRFFTLMEREEILSLEKQHAETPHERIMQKALAKDVTTRVHSAEEDFLMIFDGVPQCQIPAAELEIGVQVVDLVTEKSQLFPSKGEARRMIAQGGLSVNKMKIDDPTHAIDSRMLLNGKYLLFQKGRKNYFIVKAGELKCH
jgi:tyrosyl-tRNA synthetase